MYLLFNILYLLLTVSTVHAQSIRYPIKELSGCRNAQECYLFCQIPQNTPACWSYAKFRLPAVLGEQDTTLEQQAKLARIKFPITSLGNCANATTCHQYCQQPVNQTACIAFARSAGLAPKDTAPVLSSKILTAAKNELGCDSAQSCMSICQQPGFHEKCQNFSDKYKIAASDSSQKPSRAILNNAKKELQCDSEITCSNFCNQEENRDHCTEFAKKNKLYHEDPNIQMYMEAKKKMLDEAKKELGCDTFESCSRYCSYTANQEKCMSLGKKYQSGQLQQQTGGQGISKPSGCTTEAECKAYCQKHPDECPGFTLKSTTNRSGVPIQPYSSGSSGDYLGPSGCKTESECNAYCEKHPGECPGYTMSQPSSQTTSYPTPNPTYYQTYPTGTTDSTYQYNIQPTQSTTNPTQYESYPTYQPSSQDQYSYPTP